MKNTILIDLDGTLANVDHRTNLVRRKKKWFDKFYELCHKDTMNDWCKAIILGMHAAGFYIEIVSARPKSTYLLTAEWLNRNGINFNLPRISLNLLREQKDYTPDVELKRNWLKTLEGFKKENILFVIDDRQRVVDMWRKEGLTCLQCYAWEEFNAKKVRYTP